MLPGLSLIEETPFSWKGRERTPIGCALCDLCGGSGASRRTGCLERSTSTTCWMSSGRVHSARCARCASLLLYTTCCVRLVTLDMVYLQSKKGDIFLSRVHLFLLMTNCSTFITTGFDSSLSYPGQGSPLRLMLKARSQSTSPSAQRASLLENVDRRWNCLAHR